MVWYVSKNCFKLLYWKWMPYLKIEDKEFKTKCKHAPIVHRGRLKNCHASYIIIYTHSGFNTIYVTTVNILPTFQTTFKIISQHFKKSSVNLKTFLCLSLIHVNQSCSTPPKSKKGFSPFMKGSRLVILSNLYWHLCDIILCEFPSHSGSSPWELQHNGV